MQANRTVVSLGLAAPLLLSLTSAADVHLSAVAQPIDGFEDFVSMVVNVYVVLDGTDPATNFVTVVGGLPGDGTHVRVLGGQFFSHPGNTHGEVASRPCTSSCGFLDLRSTAS